LLGHPLQLQVLIPILIDPCLLCIFDFLLEKMNLLALPVDPLILGAVVKAGNSFIGFLLLVLEGGV